MMANGRRFVYIDPAYPVYGQDRLFDSSDKVLNQDDTLAPYIRMKETLAGRGIEVHTADRLLLRGDTASCDYYSLGVLDNFELLASWPQVQLRAFVIFEPPVVAPHLYRALPQLTARFERVFIHNTVGDGYSLQGVDQSKLRPLHWPQPHVDVLEPFWSCNNRQRRLVMINGSHRPVSRYKELYSTRIEALAALQPLGKTDLYGRGWDRWYSKNALWWPYWRHRSRLMSLYKGACDSKYEVMSHYDFALCFENMAMPGYVTEKIFDCFYAGSVPVYLGAPDIDLLISPNAYIDCRKYSSWSELHEDLMNMPDSKVTLMKEAGRDFVRSAAGRHYYDSMVKIVSEDFEPSV